MPQPLFFKSLWGMSEPLSEALVRVAKAGFDGVETSFRGSAQWDKDLVIGLEKHRLKYIPLVKSQGSTVEDHLLSLGSEIERATRLPALSMTLHAGRDDWNWDTQQMFFEQVCQWQDKFKIALNVETHRGRATFTPWNTARLLETFPDLRICLDISHWVVVCERFLEDQKEAVDLAFSRTGHIHTRIGNNEGPQAVDPRGKAWEKVRDQFEEWWERAAQERTQEGPFTLTPEYGPAPYQPFDPETGVMLADPFEIAVWGMERLKVLFKTKEPDPIGAA